MLKETVPLNLVTISGMQGSGKDTLIEDLFNSPISSKERIMLCKLLSYKKCEMSSYRHLRALGPSHCQVRHRLTKNHKDG